VGSALDECFVQVQKLIFLPLQRRTGVWASVVISEEFTLFMYDKNRLCFTFDFELETFTAGVFDVAGFAENVGHNVC